MFHFEPVESTLIFWQQWKWCHRFGAYVIVNRWHAAPSWLPAKVLSAIYARQSLKITIVKYDIGVSKHTKVISKGFTDQNCRPKMAFLNGGQFFTLTSKMEEGAFLLCVFTTFGMVLSQFWKLTQFGLFLSCFPIDNRIQPHVNRSHRYLYFDQFWNTTNMWLLHCRLIPGSL